MRRLYVKKGSYLKNAHNPRIPHQTLSKGEPHYIPHVRLDAQLVKEILPEIKVNIPTRCWFWGHIVNQTKVGRVLVLLSTIIVWLVFMPAPFSSVCLVSLFCFLILKCLSDFPAFYQGRGNTLITSSLANVEVLDFFCKIRGHRRQRPIFSSI